MNKDTKEFSALPAAIINGIYKSLADGNFNLLTDATNFIQAFMAAQPAIDGFKNIKSENATMTIEERKEIHDVLEMNMGDVPADDRFDIATGMSGFLAWFRIGWRKGLNEGRAIGRDELIQELKQGVTTVDQLFE